MNNMSFNSAVIPVGSNFSIPGTLLPLAAGVYAIDGDLTTNRSLRAMRSSAQTQILHSVSIETAGKLL